MAAAGVYRGAHAAASGRELREAQERRHGATAELASDQKSTAGGDLLRLPGRRRTPGVGHVDSRSIFPCFSEDGLAASWLGDHGQQFLVDHRHAASGDII